MDNRNNKMVKKVENKSAKWSRSNSEESGAADAKVEMPLEAVVEGPKDTKCDECHLSTSGHFCVCGGTYCYMHRHSDNHECCFDYEEYVRGGRISSDEQCNGSTEARNDFKHQRMGQGICDFCRQRVFVYPCGCGRRFCAAHRKQINHKCFQLNNFNTRAGYGRSRYQHRMNKTTCGYCHQRHPYYHCECGGTFCAAHRRPFDHRCWRHKPRHHGRSGRAGSVQHSRDMHQSGKLICDRCRRRVFGYYCACGGKYCRDHLKKSEHKCQLNDSGFNGAGNGRKSWSRTNCSYCRKRSPRYPCRCGGTFCRRHRSQYDHKCNLKSPICHSSLRRSTQAKPKELRKLNGIMCDKCVVQAAGYYCACGGIFCRDHCRCIAHNCRFKDEIFKNAPKHEKSLKRRADEDFNMEFMFEAEQTATAETISCEKCRYEVSPTAAYSCHCGGTFCILHRYSVNHACSTNFCNIRNESCVAEKSPSPSEETPTLPEDVPAEVAKKVLCDKCYRSGVYSCSCGGTFCYRHRRRVKHECCVDGRSNGGRAQSVGAVAQAAAGSAENEDLEEEEKHLCDFCSKQASKYLCACDGRFCEDHRISIDHDCTFIDDLYNGFNGSVTYNGEQKATTELVHNFDTRHEFGEEPTPAGVNRKQWIRNIWNVTKSSDN